MQDTADIPRMALDSADGRLDALTRVQVLAGGGLQPSSQGVLLDAFPPEKMFGVAALLAPVVGPTLGGYLTVTYGWRWIFLINLPVGALALLVCESLSSTHSGHRHSTQLRLGICGGDTNSIG